MSPQRPSQSLVALLGILTLVSTSLIGCASSDATDKHVKPVPAMTEPGGGGPARYESPQAAYDAAKAATKAKEYRAFSDCLTPESQDMMAGAMICQSLMMKGIAAQPLGGPEDEQDRQNLEASCKALDALLAKHGVNQDQLQAFQAMDPAAPPEEGMAALAKLTTPIKDKPAFLAEIMSAMDSISSAYAGKLGGAGGIKETSMFEGRLEKIEVERDHATAQVVFTLAGEGQRAPIGFRKVNSGWLVDLMVLGRKPE